MKNVNGQPQGNGAMLVYPCNLNVDNTNTLVTMDFAQFRSYEGDVWNCVKTFQDVGSSTTVYLLLTTGSRKMRFIFYAEGSGIRTGVYEAPPGATGGTPQSVYNMERNNLGTNGFTVTHTPTVTNVGTVHLVDMSTGAPGKGAGQARSGGAIKSNTVWTLKPNTKYLLYANNYGTSACDITLGFECAEV